MSEKSKEEFPLLVVSRVDLLETIQHTSSVVEYTVELMELIDALRPMIPKGEHSDYFKRIDAQGLRIMSASKRLNTMANKLKKDCH
jgi:hypothetical protein